jgi:O-antigen/teichoic acid export membrane protein
MSQPASVGWRQTGNAAHRVARNTLYLSLADVSSKLMMFVFYMVSARHLGVEKFGLFSFALAFVSMFSVLTDLGLGGLVAREIAKRPAAGYQLVGTGLSIKLAASLVVIGMIALATFLLRYDVTTRVVLAICSLFVLETAFAQYCMSVFQGMERMEFSAIGRVPQAVVLVIGVFLLSSGPAVVQRYALLYVSAGFVSATLVTSIVAVRFAPLRLNLRLREWGRALGPALPFGISGIFVTLYYWNGSALMSRLAGDTAVGVYSAPFRLVMGLALIGMAFAGSMYPVMSRSYHERPESTEWVLLRAVRYMLVLVLPVAAIAGAFADRVVLLVYGAEFAASVAVLRILVGWGVFACFNGLLSNYFFARDQARTVGWQSGISLGVNVLLNILLIPTSGARGAAVAILAAELAGFVFLVARRQPGCSALTPADVMSTAARVLASTLVAVGVGWGVGRRSFAAGIGASVVLYVPLLLLFRALTATDLCDLRDIIGFKGRVRSDGHA